MAKIGKNVVDAELRNEIFNDLFSGKLEFTYEKVNDRQYGVIRVDKNGNERYCRLGVIVAEEREDMTAQELMEKEKNAYADKQAEKAEKAKEKAEKIAHDKARRAEKAKQEKEE